MIHLGSYNTATTRTHVGFQFTTSSGAGGLVAPASAFEAADLKIYRAADGAAYSATERSSANGVTMTSPFDSVVGFHSVDIDLTDNTDAGFYAAGYRYSVVLLPDETVDGETVGKVLAYFEIGPPPVNAAQIGGQTASAAGTVTFPNATLASTTNITAGTITTVTNLTNAPTAGDLTATMKASVNTEVDAAIETYHLDHLLAATYDPASKPGASDALLNELVENDGGVARYTANALEEAPSGGGGGTDWDADERTAIRAILGIPASGTTPADPTTGILDTIRDYIDTEIAAVKAKTDQLVFTKANELDANIQSINGTTITGDGSSGNKFGV